MLKLSVSIGQAVQIGGMTIRLERKTSRSVHMLIDADRSLPISLIKEPGPLRRPDTMTAIPLLAAPGSWGVNGIFQQRLKTAEE